MCDQGFGPSPGRPAPSARPKTEIGGIGGLPDEDRKDLPRRNPNVVSPYVIPAHVHQLNEGELPTERTRKCASKISATELLVLLLEDDYGPIAPVHRCLDKP